MALPIGPDGKTVQSAVDDIVQWVRSGELEYEFERRAKALGLDIEEVELPEGGLVLSRIIDTGPVPELRGDTPMASLDRTSTVGLVIGDESVRSDYYIGTDKFIWTYRRREGGKVVVFSSPEVVPPNSSADYARFLGYARAMTKEKADG